MRKISRFLKPNALFVALVLGLVTSCASQQSSDTPPEFEQSEAALLSETDGATPVTYEAAVFADLANAKHQDSEINTTSAAASLAPADNADSPFYNPVGGEDLGRVAYILYGSRKMRSKLEEKNPDLKDVKNLTTDQRVYFDFNRLNPKTMFLTKDLLDRYPSQLAEKIEKHGLNRETVTVSEGETLQTLSKRLYGTSRYWTEIYLLNHEIIPHYDRVKAGMTLTVFQRNGIAAPSTEPTPPSAPIAQAPSQPQPEAVAPIAPAPAEPAPVTTPSAPVAIPTPAPETSAPTQPAAAAPIQDPIPETPPSPAPQEVVQETPPANVDAQEVEGQDPAGNANFRRLIYVGLILVLGGAALFFTRSSRKKNFDMLDVTTDTTASRSKLNNKNSQKQGLG